MCLPQKNSLEPTTPMTNGFTCQGDESNLKIQPCSVASSINQVALPSSAFCSSSAFCCSSWRQTVHVWVSFEKSGGLCYKWIAVPNSLADKLWFEAAKILKSQSSLKHGGLNFFSKALSRQNISNISSVFYSNSCLLKDIPSTMITLR